MYFDEPAAPAVASAIRDLRAAAWRAETIQDVAKRFSEERFVERIIDATSAR